LTKPPCPSCGSSLYDIHKSQRLGCPECYKHYKNELLPVLVHAHKSCEHVGKSPKQCEITSNEENITTLNLKFKQALEQENYEKCAEIKKELENLNKNTPPQQ
jgi:protein arginine kinase activator